MNPSLLLKNETAQRLYETYARDLPIIDYHNHLDPADLDRRYQNITELWLECDPYKHRLMRICGVEEHFITGNASPLEKFQTFCTVFPRLAGTPVYDWCRMELRSVFGIEELPGAENAEKLFEKLNKLLQKEEFLPQNLLQRFRVEYHSPVAALGDELTPFTESGTAPSLRGDELLTRPLPADLTERLDAFEQAGCRIADHALDEGFFRDGNTATLVTLAKEYAARGWTLLLHLGALRQTSTTLAKEVGPAGGYAAIGSTDIPALVRLLDEMEQHDALPHTVLFPLNPAEMPSLAILAGSFKGGKVQLGPAWWWNDHAMGIRQTLDCLANYGVLSQFIGMTTDSRSPLSFVRHDYFRQVLCQWLSEQDWGLPEEELGSLIQDICYFNAKRRIDRVSK